MVPWLPSDFVSIPPRHQVLVLLLGILLPPLVHKLLQPATGLEFLIFGQKLELPLLRLLEVVRGLALLDSLPLLGLRIDHRQQGRHQRTLMSPIIEVPSLTNDSQHQDPNLP